MIGKASNLIAQPLQGINSSLVRQLLGNARYSTDTISMAGEITTPEMYDYDGIMDAVSASLNLPPTEFEYGLTEGQVDLREEIVKALREHRDVHIDTNSILITTGAQQALHIACRVLTDYNDVIAVADATYFLAVQTFQISRGRVLSIPTDEEGVVPDELEKLLKQQRIKALYVIPNNANPTGTTLPIDRRKRLIELAEHYDFAIIEDDPYGVFRFDGKVLPSIFSLAAEMNASERVMLLCSFSGMFIPSIRIGFMVARGALYKAAVVVKQYVDIHTCGLSQRVLENYLKSGRIVAQVNRLRITYEERCDELIKAFDRHLPDHFTYHRPEGGVFLWGEFSPTINALELLKYAVEEKFLFLPGAAFYADKPNYKTARFCYSSVEASRMDEAVKRLSKAVKRYLADKAQEGK